MARQFCARCGLEMEIYKDITTFCPKCGDKISEIPTTQSSYSPPQTDTTLPQSKGYGSRVNSGKNRFISPDEKEIARLGNGAISDFTLTKVPRNTFSVITDRRVYFTGKLIELSEWNIIKTYSKKKVSKIVDLQDVTCTSVRMVGNAYYLIIAIFFFTMDMNAANVAQFYPDIPPDVMSAGVNILSLILLTISVILFLMYLLKHITVLSIEFVGGNVAFDIKRFSKLEIETFHRALRLAKDRAVKAQGV